jgi:hypothetical protein
VVRSAWPIRTASLASAIRSKPATDVHGYPECLGNGLVRCAGSAESKRDGVGDRDLEQSGLAIHVFVLREPSANVSSSRLLNFPVPLAAEVDWRPLTPLWAGVIDRVTCAVSSRPSDFSSPLLRTAGRVSLRTHPMEPGGEPKNTSASTAQTTSPRITPAERPARRWRHRLCVLVAASLVAPAAVAVLLAAPAAAAAVTMYVAQGGSDTSNNCATTATPCATPFPTR